MYACAYPALVICRNESFRIRSSLSHNSRDRTINDPTARRLQWPPTRRPADFRCYAIFIAFIMSIEFARVRFNTRTNTSVLIRLSADPPRVRRSRRNVVYADAGNGRRVRDTQARSEISARKHFFEFQISNF